jgi:hypothetical protein
MTRRCGAVEPLLVLDTKGKTSPGGADRYSLAGGAAHLHPGGLYRQVGDLDGLLADPEVINLGLQPAAGHDN